MKKIIAAIAFAFAASSAFAGDADNAKVEAGSTKTRAEVKAELKEFNDKFVCVATNTKYPDDCLPRDAAHDEAVRTKIKAFLKKLFSMSNSPVDMSYRSGE